ncbi:MAG: zf-HC2 domain-containing protein [Thermomicrobiales bacterium]
MAMIDPGDLPCQEFVEMVSDYLAGTLSPRDRQRFEWHLAVCPPCVSYLAQIRDVAQVAAKLRRAPLDPGSRDHLLAAFRDWNRQPPGRLSPGDTR